MNIGDKVIKNLDTWIPNCFDVFGRGVGIGIVVEPPFEMEDNEVDVRWEGGRYFEYTEHLIKKLKMKYYKSNDKLVKYNPKSDKWFWCNKLGDKLIDKPMLLEPIKPNLFNQLLNEWYRTVKDEWEYQGVRYRKDLCFKDNKELYDTLPSHKLTYSDDCKIVYHKGTLYYACTFHLCPKLILFDFKTKEWCRRSNLNGCFAVMNLETKEYI